MSTTYEIPFTALPQRFTCKLGVTTYSITLLWCAPNQSWVINLEDENGVPILNSIPLVTGADLFQQYAYLNLGGQLFVETTNMPTAVPTFQNLGTEGHAYFVVP